MGGAETAGGRNKAREIQMKRHPEKLTFSRRLLRAQDFVDALLKYEGILYSPHANWTLLKDGAIVNGRANCFGVLLMAANDCELWDGSPNLPPAEYEGQTSAKTLAEILDYNFNEVAYSEMREGDILSFRYRDVDWARREPHHIGAYVGNGQFFHASQDAGKCIVSPLDVLMQTRIDKVLRLPNLIYAP